MIVLFEFRVDEIIAENQFFHPLYKNKMASYLGRQSQYITGRTENILVFNEITRSRTLAEAHLKVLKFYRSACRRMPYLLKAHNISDMVQPIEARLNLGQFIRKNSYVRNAAVIDMMVSQGYEWLHESVWLYNHVHNFSAMVLPHTAHETGGYSYLEEVKFAGCSKFLKDFYKGGNQPKL